MAILSRVAGIFVSGALMGSCVSGAVTPAPPATSPAPVTQPLAVQAPTVYDSMMTCLEQEPVVSRSLLKMETLVEQERGGVPHVMDDVLDRTATIESLALPAQSTLDRSGTPLSPESEASASRIVDRCTKGAEQVSGVAHLADLGLPVVQPSEYDRTRKRALKNLHNAAFAAADYIRANGDTRVSQNATAEVS